MTTTTTTTTKWVSNITLTEAEFNRELIICKGIFLDYTDYHLNAVMYRLVSEEKYRGDCMHLNSLYYLLTNYWYNSNEDSYYLGGLPVDESHVQRVIDLIHHYGVLQITVLASGFNNAQEGGYACLDTIREIYASSTYVHTISVNSGCSLFQVFLNGSLISGDDWSYVGNTFIYLGSIVLQDNDWFYLYFKCGCSQGCSSCTGTTTTTTTEIEPKGYSIKFVQHVCSYTDIIPDTTTTTTTTILEVEIHFVEHVCEMYESETTTTSTSTTSSSTTTTTTTIIIGDCSFGIINTASYYSSTEIGRGMLYNGYIQSNISSITSSDDWRIAGGNAREDYYILLTYLGASIIEPYSYQLDSLILKETGNVYWETNNGLNSVNFNARPSGFIDTNGSFYNSNNECMLGCRNAWDSVLAINDTGLTIWTGGYGDGGGCSIRLVRDATENEQLLVDGTYLSPYIGNNGISYKTVKIGTQIWLAENLSETQYRDGSYVVQAFTSQDWIDNNTSLIPCGVSLDYEFNQGLVILN